MVGLPTPQNVISQVTCVLISTPMFTANPEEFS